MKPKIFLLLAAFAAFCVPALATADETKLPVTYVAPGVEVSVEKLPPLIVEGTNPPQGVAGAFIDFFNVACVYFEPGFVVAGGALFPDKGPADGGKKKFYDTIWKLYPKRDASWSVCEEKLPVPAAYGVSNGVWFGGENENGKLDNIWGVRGGREVWKGSGVVVEALGSLPVRIDNAAGAGRWIGGGNVNGVPANKAFKQFVNSFPGKEDEWHATPDFPGTPRVQPVAGIVDTPRGRAFVLVGGFYFDPETKKATVDRAGVIYYEEENKWEMLPPLPEEISEAGLVGSCAVQDGRGRMLIFGGVNAKIFKEALENPAPDYLRHEPEWYKFNADVLRLSFGKDGNAKWEKLATVPATARAGASVMRAGGSVIYPYGCEIIFVCGELKPGFRSPDCCRIVIKLKD